MYEYLNAASMMESRRNADLNRRLEIRRVGLERIAEQHLAEQRIAEQRIAEQGPHTVRPNLTVRVAAGIRHLLPHTAARRTRTAHHA